MNDMPLTLRELQTDVVVWADSISPTRRPKDAVVKVVSEASELLDAVLNDGDVEGELGDLIILLLDLANMYRINIVRAGSDKMVINRQRHWRSDHGVIRRLKGSINGEDPLR